MTRSAPLLLLTVLLAGCAAPPHQTGVPERAPARVALVAPDSVAGLARTGTHRFPDPSAGTLYRYRGPGLLRPDVYLYPVPDEELSSRADSVAARESENFKAVLPIQQRRGRFSSYEILVDEPVQVAFGSVRVPGWHVMARLRRGSEELFTHQYLFVDRGNYVKIRDTHPSIETAAANQLRTWVEALVRAVAGGTPA